MTSLHKRAFLALMGVLALASAAALLPASAADVMSADGTIKVSGAWTRATPAGAKTAGGFVQITNLGKQADTLIGGTLVSAGKVEIHEMSMANGVMKMAPLADGLEIKPGATVELKPGGYHVMFLDLATAVKAGERVEGTLVFKQAGTVKVTYDAAAMGAKSAAPPTMGTPMKH